MVMSLQFAIFCKCLLPHCKVCVGSIRYLSKAAIKLRRIIAGYAFQAFSPDHIAVVG
jgi:hypothetical protein